MSGGHKILPSLGKNNKKTENKKLHFSCHQMSDERRIKEAVISIVILLWTLKTNKCCISEYL